jgi:hypothetical protein
VSRDPPPLLPGGYTVGEKVFYTWANFTFPSGDKVVHGQQGEVMGPATHKSVKGNGVIVLFPGNTVGTNCFLTQVRPPPRPRLRCHPPPAPHTRDAAHAPSVPATASAAAPQPSLHEQPLAPPPTARVREGWWPSAWSGV